MRIIICDDHLLFVQALATALAEQGFVVEAAATTPEEAVRAVALHDPDVVLLDVMFPAADGLDAARRIRLQHPRTKVVMITGTQSVEPLAVALEIGVAGYLGKNQPVEAIAEKLRRAAQGELMVDRGLLRRLRGTTVPLPRRHDPVAELTERERQVLALLELGMDTEGIVERLGISRSTVRTHVQSILSKMGVHSRVQALAALTAAQPGRGGRRDPH